MLPGGSTSGQSYDLEFTLPTAGKSGCMVCHGDENLIRPVAGGFVSYWVDGEVLDASAHAGISCVGCHTDFAFRAPHKAEAADWRATAKLACKNCHQEQFEAYSRGVHSISVKPGELPERERRNGGGTKGSSAAAKASNAATAGSAAATGTSAVTTGTSAVTTGTSSVPTAPPAAVSTPTPVSDAEKPLCGDCHGAHGISALTDDPDGRLELHRRGFEVCGRCHEDQWDSYDDYYHGRAFKLGVWDAPSCWRCHGAHGILPSSDRRSTASEQNLVGTCGACHRDATEDFVVSTVGMIHGRGEALEDNVAYSFIAGAVDRVAGFLSGDSR